MDEETAWRLFNEGQPVSLIIDGQRVNPVLVTGLSLGFNQPRSIDALLPTPIDEPDRRRRIGLETVELAP